MNNIGKYVTLGGVTVGIGLILYKIYKEYNKTVALIDAAEEEKKSHHVLSEVGNSDNIVEGLFKTFEKTEAGNVDEAFDADRGKVIHILQNSGNLEYLFEIPESIFTKGYKPFMISDFVRTLRNEGTNIASELCIKPSFGGLRIFVFVEYEYEDAEGDLYYACGEIPTILLEEYKTERDPKGITTFYEKIVGGNVELLNNILPTIFTTSKRKIKNIKAVDYTLVYKISFNILGESQSPSGISISSAHTALEKFLNISVTNRNNKHTWTNVIFQGKEPGRDESSLLWYYQRDRDGNISVDNYVYDD
jgi:hypothetical protein